MSDVAGWRLKIADLEAELALGREKMRDMIEHTVSREGYEQCVRQRDEALKKTSDLEEALQELVRAAKKHLDAITQADKEGVSLDASCGVTESLFPLSMALACARAVLGGKGR